MREARQAYSQPPKNKTANNGLKMNCGRCLIAASKSVLPSVLRGGAVTYADFCKRVVSFGQPGLTEQALRINRTPAREAGHSDGFALQIGEVIQSAPPP